MCSTKLIVLLEIVRVRIPGSVQVHVRLHIHVASQKIHNIHNRGVQTVKYLSHRGKEGEGEKYKPKPLGKKYEKGGKIKENRRKDNTSRRIYKFFTFFCA
jgi:hypothetical protein